MIRRIASALHRLERKTLWMYVACRNHASYLEKLRVRCPVDFDKYMLRFNRNCAPKRQMLHVMESDSTRPLSLLLVGAHIVYISTILRFSTVSSKATLNSSMVGARFSIESTAQKHELTPALNRLGFPSHPP